jgi:hypothetical protein
VFVQDEGWLANVFVIPIQQDFSRKSQEQAEIPQQDFNKDWLKVYSNSFFVELFTG